MENNKKSLECAAFYDKSQRSGREISVLIEGFLEYARYELNFSPLTVSKYRESLGWFIRDIGDKDVSALTVEDFVRLKRLMVDRGVGQARICSVVFAVRSLLTY